LAEVVTSTCRSRPKVTTSPRDRHVGHPAPAAGRGIAVIPIVVPTRGWLVTGPTPAACLLDTLGLCARRRAIHSLWISLWILQVCRYSPLCNEVVSPGARWGQLPHLFHNVRQTWGHPIVIPSRLAAPHASSTSSSTGAMTRWPGLMPDVHRIHSRYDDDDSSPISRSIPDQTLCTSDAGDRWHGAGRGRGGRRTSFATPPAWHGEPTGANLMLPEGFRPGTSPWPRSAHGIPRGPATTEDQRW